MQLLRKASRPALFVTVLISILVAAVGEASARNVAIDDYVRQQMIEKRMAGLAVAVLHRGQVIKMGAYGKASIEHGVPVRASTPFSVASISESFTSVAVRQYGLGWVLSTDDPHPFVGGTGGLRAALFIYPRTRSRSSF